MSEPGSPAAGERGAVVITGTSSGIGEACAKRLHELGFTVFAGVRRTQDGERLRRETSERLVPVSIDVTDQTSIRQAVDAVADALGDRDLGGLVNNAGAVTAAAPLEFVSIDDLRLQLEVNTVGQVAVTQAFLPMLRRGNGRVVNIGSIGGRVALPFNGPYSASKFAIEAISDALRRELRPWGISVSLIEPGSVATEIWRKGEQTFRDVLAKLPPEAHQLYDDALREFAAAVRATASRGIPPAEVATAVEHALTATRPKTRYLVGRDAKQRAAVMALASDRLADRLIEHGLRAQAARGS